MGKESQYSVVWAIVFRPRDNNHDHSIIWHYTRLRDNTDDYVIVYSIIVYRSREKNGDHSMTWHYTVYRLRDKSNDYII